MQTICIVNQKGGVGKTTTAVNLGAAMAMAGSRVLVADLDPQAAASAWLGFPQAGNELERVYTEGLDMEQAIHPGPLPNLSVAPSGASFARVEGFLNSEPGSEAVLRSALSPLASHFHLVLLDCPPNLGRVAASALMAATHVLIPVTPSALDIHAVSQNHGIMDTVARIKRGYNSRLSVLGLLMTRVDHTNNTASLVEWCAQNYPSYLLETRIRNTVKLREAAMQARPIELYDRTCNGALDYRALAVEITSRLAATAGTPVLA